MKGSSDKLSSSASFFKTTQAAGTLFKIPEIKFLTLTKISVNGETFDINFFSKPLLTLFSFFSMISTSTVNAREIEEFFYRHLNSSTVIKIWGEKTSVESLKEKALDLLAKGYCNFNTTLDRPLEFYVRTCLKGDNTGGTCNVYLSQDSAEPPIPKDDIDCIEDLCEEAQKASTAAIVGVVVGIVVIALLACAIMACYQKYKNKEANRPQ